MITPKQAEEATREIQCLISLNGITPRTENKSLLNYNLDRRKKALETTLELLTAYSKGELIKPMSEEEIENVIFDLVHSGYVRYFNSDNLNDERETARRIGKALKGKI